MQQSPPPCLLSLAQIAPDFSVSSSVRYCIDLSFSTQHWVQLFTIQVLPRKHRCISNLPNDFPDKLPLRCSFLTEKWMRLKLRVRQETASLPVSGRASVSGSRVHCSDWVCHTVTLSHLTLLLITVCHSFIVYSRLLIGNLSIALHYKHGQTMNAAQERFMLKHLSDDDCYQ